MRVLLVTSQWPSPTNPSSVPFLVREVQSIRSHGVNIDVFHYEGGFSVNSYLRTLSRLKQEFSNRDYDLIHGQFGVGGLFGLFFPNKPLVVTFQGSDLNGIYDHHGKLTNKGFLLRKTSQLVSLLADEVIIVSETMSTYLPCKNYKVIPSGIDFDLFRPYDKIFAKSKLSLDPNKNYVLFTGGKENIIKRYYLAEEAVNLLKPQHNIELLVANGIEPNEMPVYLSACDCLLLTSSREGSPNIVKEALACNCPVVTVNVGDVKHRLSGIEGCVISDNDSADTIATALQQVIAFEGKFESRSRVAAISLDAVAEEIIKVYHEAIEKKLKAKRLR